MVPDSLANVLCGRDGPASGADEFLSNLHHSSSGIDSREPLHRLVPALGGVSVPVF